MNEARLKRIAEAHAPDARIQPLLFLNEKLTDATRMLTKARRMKGTAEKKEERIRTALEEIYDCIQYVAQPSVTAPMETCILLKLVELDIFDLGISASAFKKQENQNFFIDVEEALSTQLARIPLVHSARAKEIIKYLRVIKFLPCIQNEVAYKEGLNQNARFKWMVLALGIVFSLFIAIGLGNFQPIVPGIFLSIAGYAFITITSNKGNSDNTPGGFNEVYAYLSKRSRYMVKQSYMQAYENILITNHWMAPNTLSQAQQLRGKCDYKIVQIANPATQVKLPEQEMAQEPEAVVG